MDLKRIEILIEKYYEGKTSLSEENELSTFFTYNEVPEHLQAETHLFKGLAPLKTEKMQAEVVLNSKPKKGKLKAYRLYAGISIAASLLILLGVAIFNQNNAIENNADNNSIVMVKNTVKTNNKKEAYNETKKALMLVSTKLNIGMKEMGRLSEFDKSQQLIKKDSNNKKDKNENNN